MQDPCTQSIVQAYYRVIIVVTMVQRFCPVNFSMLIFLLLPFYFCFVSLTFRFRVFVLFLLNLCSCFGFMIGTYAVKPTR